MRIATILGSLAIVLGSGIAHADQVRSTRFDLRERVHDITVRVERGSVTLVVRRTVQNLGPKSDQVVFTLDLPAQAVATRLRTQGDANQWFEGELLDAEDAAAKYRELTGIGGYYPKDPALLSWRRRGELALQVFPVAARSDKTVEYTLEMPMRYERGSYRLELPVLGTDALPARVHVVAVQTADTLRVNGARVRGTQLIESNPFAPGRSIDIELEPRGAGVVTMRLADVRIAEGRRLLHASFDAAPKLGMVPNDAAVAIVLDTSKSMAANLPAALTALRAYLSHFANGQISLVTFDRTVHRPLGTSGSVASVLAALHSWTPTLGNGSALDAAILAADRTLAVSGRSVRRMLVVSDLNLRAALTADKLGSLDLASGAILHLARVTAGSTRNERNDEDEFAALPRKTGGLLWDAHCSADDPGARNAFEQWARPMRIDHLKILGLAEYAGDASELAEGEAIEHLALASTGSPNVYLEGELWSRPFRSSASPREEEARRWSALVFGSSLSDELSEPEQKLLAMKGRAVSPMTSYLAIEPGVRPSTEGLDEAEGGFGSGFAAGLSGKYHAGAQAQLKSSSFDPLAFLQRQLGVEWKRCGGSAAAKIQVQSTFVEVVDVSELQVSTLDQSRKRCLTEAAWSLDLPSDFEAASAVWAVEVQP